MKPCTKCKIMQCKSEFYNDSYSRDGLSCWCKTCKQKNQKVYQENNRDKINAYSKKWVSNNPEKCKARQNNWRAKNPSYMSEYMAKRNAKCNSNTDQELYYLEKVLIDELYVLRMVLSEMEDGQVYHIDHVHPISKGGAHNLTNLEILTAEENISKKDKILKEEN